VKTLLKTLSVALSDSDIQSDYVKNDLSSLEEPLKILDFMSTNPTEMGNLLLKVSVLRDWPPKCEKAHPPFNDNILK